MPSPGQGQTSQGGTGDGSGRSGPPPLELDELLEPCPPELLDDENPDELLEEVDGPDELLELDDPPGSPELLLQLEDELKGPSLEEEQDDELLEGHPNALLDEDELLELDILVPFRF